MAPELVTAMSITLSPAELADLTGGYTQPAKQMEVLKKRGFWRAFRSEYTGQVVLERAHYLAVSQGLDKKPEAGRPRVRVPA